jgi:transcriptional regulator with XRE-family HTH domain
MALTEQPGDTGDERGGLRVQLQLLVREARLRAGLTQEQLGRQIGVSRFIINRVEGGVTDITPALAERLGDALDLDHLTELVASRDQPEVGESNRRDAVLSRLMATPGLISARFVLADMTDLYSLIHTRRDGDARLRCGDVEIVLPTLARARTLFGADSRLNGHFRYQVKRLLDLKKSVHYVANTLRLYESDQVVTAMAVTESGRGHEAAVWPPLALSEGPGDEAAPELPVAVTTDRRTVDKLHEHLNDLTSGREPIRSNEAICRVDPQGSAPTRFTRFFTVGEDQEEDVADTEGAATVLVLVLALCVRAEHGLGRRAIVYIRPDSRQDRKLSLFSNSVEDIDVQAAQAAARGWEPSERRSHRHALNATLKFSGFLQSVDMQLPDHAYRNAAAREMAMFDLDVDPERFREIPLPPELSLVRKPPSIVGTGRAAIAPRLLVLELQGDDPDQPELAVLQAKADVEEFGIQDLVHEVADTAINDFLLLARNNGLLESLLRDLGVVEH